jgi:hypothetical protein
VIDDGAKLLRGALARCFRLPAEIGPLRTVLDAGLSSAVEALSVGDQTFVDEFYDNDDMFIDRAAFEKALPREALAKRLTEMKITNAEMAADAATLLFAHASVDATAIDCCRAITFLDPARCKEWVGALPFNLSEIMATEPNDLLRLALDKRLGTLERESLLNKVDVIYRNCKPEAGWTRLTGYNFDRTRLVKIDDIRHDVVHTVGVGAIRRLGEGDKEFLEKTGLHLVLLTMITFGVKVDPSLLVAEGGAGAAQ